MKKHVIMGVGLLSLGAIAFSCEKEVITTKTSSSNETELNNKARPDEKDPLKYRVDVYLDGKSISEKELQLKDNDNYIYISPKQEKNENIILVEAFSTEDSYVKFGIEHNLYPKEHLAFEKEIRAYAAESGTIDYYEKTGELPKEYKKYEKQIYNKHLGKLPQNKTSVTTLYKDFFGGSSWVMVNYLPFMPPGWNNTVSSFVPVGLYGVTHLYDRSFYRTRMATLWGWGFTRVSFFWAWLNVLNDRTSSVLSF